MPTFTVQKGYDKTTDMEIGDGNTVIGRDPACEVVLDAGDVSRKHARVIKQGKKVFIEDLNSQNGTFVNSSPIDDKCELKHLDVIQIGKNMFVFNDDIDLSESLAERGMDSGMKTAQFQTFDFATSVVRRIETNIASVFKGKPEVIKYLIVCLFADGHLLIEDVPGVGKSMLAQALAKCIHGVYHRIQFTPDMLPSDITGVSIYNEKERDFNFMPGPIFGNVILADEINRTTPRTQSSLLECMSESVITIDGKPHVMPKPFFVIATQNPSDYHGTYPLPEPQLDRFMMRLSIGYPDAAAEREIIESQVARHPLNQISYVVSAMDIVNCSAMVRSAHLSDPVKDYIIKIIEATRNHEALVTGCSPRATLAFMRCCQSLATYHGREYVIPKDAKELAVHVLAHRLTLKPRAHGKWADTRAVIGEIVESIPLENEEGQI